MATLSDRQIESYAAGAGFNGRGLQIAIAVCLAESGGNPTATNQNKNSAGQTTSTDRGLWQINNVFHSEVSDSCAFNPSCAAASAYKISSSGNNWQPWSTFNNGAYQKFMPRAQAAVGAGPVTTPAPIPSGTSGAPMTVPATPNNFGLVAGTADALQTQKTLSFTGKSVSKSVFAPLNVIVALGIVFGVLFFIGKSRWGYVAIYYTEILILFFLFVTQAQFFKQHLSVLTGIGSQNETSYVSELAVRTAENGTIQQGAVGNPEFSPPTPTTGPTPAPVIRTF